MTEPFFTQPATSVRSDARILLISYHFAPASTAGALRWQKLAAHASLRGSALDVVTLHPSDVQRPDPGSLVGLPPGTRVFGVPTPALRIDRLENAAWGRVRRIARRKDSNPGGTAAAASGSRGRPGSLAHQEMAFRTVADLRRTYHSWRAVARERAWADAAGAIAARIVDPGIHRLVVSCGPPHMVHLAASRLARRNRLPHIVDMRDPWSLVERLPESIASPLGIRLARRYEAPVISRAALVVANTEPARTALQRRYPDAAERTITVMNGYDDDPVPIAPRSSRFLLAYAGTVYLDRDPRPLFRAAARLRTELRLDEHQLGIEFMGEVFDVDGRSVLDLAQEAGAGGLVRVHPPGPRSDAERFLAGASMLVSLPQDSHMAIPSKVFEYLRFPAWLLALAEPWSATALALHGTRADVVPPGDETALTEVIRTRFLQHREGVVPEPEPPGGPLSRAEQARILFDALDGVVGGQDSGAARPIRNTADFMNAATG